MNRFRLPIVLLYFRLNPKVHFEWSPYESAENMSAILLVKGRLGRIPDEAFGARAEERD